MTTTVYKAVATFHIDPNLRSGRTNQNTYTSTDEEDVDFWIASLQRSLNQDQAARLLGTITGPEGEYEFSVERSTITITEG